MLIAVGPYPADFLRRVPRLRLVEKPVKSCITRGSTP
jgi:hypothetical protein